MAPRRLVRLAAALAGFACGLGGAELAGRQLRTAPAAPAPLLFSLVLRDATGALLASPLLVGEEGRPLHLSLSQPPGGPRTPGQHRGTSDQPGLQMSLELEPGAASERAICLQYRLALDSGERHEGRLAVTLGEPQTLQLRGSERYTLDLMVARAGSPEFHQLLRSRGRPVI